MEPDLEYYRRRLAEELSAVERSQTDGARHCHRTLAAAYSLKINSLAPGQDVAALIAA